jgi:hypothetical protein
MMEKDVEKALLSLIFTTEAKDCTGASRKLLIWVTINVVATVAIVRRVLTSNKMVRAVFAASALSVHRVYGRQD